MATWRSTRYTKCSTENVLDNIMEIEPLIFYIPCITLKQSIISIADVVSEKSYFTRLGLNILIRQTNSQPLVQMTAKEFMFGYSNALMTLGNNFMPSWIYFDKLGLIDRMYDFEGDYETIFTGTEHGLSNIGLIDTYSGSSKIPQWDGPCGDVTGASDGTKIPWKYKRKRHPTVLQKKHVSRLVKRYPTVSIPGYTHLTLKQTTMVMSTRRTNVSAKDRKKCLPPGLLDVRGCYYGFPIALSYPHFWNGDASLSAKVNGTHPDPEKHKTFFVIEPKAGLPIELAVRYQINMALGNIKTIANCDRFNDMVLPLLWTEIRLYELPPTLSLRFRMYLNILPVAEKMKSDKKLPNTPWIQEEFVYNIDRKLNSYIPVKKNSSTEKELEVCIHHLVEPLNIRNS
ncbi:hypothetical protein NQ317_016103 [Molorchus minor]|uniref:Uncharacterized protein n=1 Tax=Molorchus minor TaxID=1323400 RepID=A0ABQ9JI58_9CUCU|nr:hypothetical protein NQ317_016103 [Molorchus minor]